MVIGVVANIAVSSTFKQVPMATRYSTISLIPCMKSFFTIGSE
jgi:hypothetical protein